MMGLDMLLKGMGVDPKRLDELISNASTKMAQYDADLQEVKTLLREIRDHQRREEQGNA